MVFHALTFARSREKCWKPRPKGVVFNTSLGTWRMLIHRSLLLHKNWNHLLHFALFLALFCFAFSLTSRVCNFHGLCSFYGRALHISWRQLFCGPGTSILEVALPCINIAWIALLIHGFSPVNARLLITCGTAFYAIISDACAHQRHLDIVYTIVPYLISELALDYFKDVGLCIWMTNVKEIKTCLHGT